MAHDRTAAPSPGVPSVRKPAKLLVEAGGETDLTEAWGAETSRSLPAPLPGHDFARIPTERYEREADRVADDVTKGENGADKACECGNTCSDCLQERPLLPGRAIDSTTAIQTALPDQSAARSSVGEPLDTTSRLFMERSIGRDFSRIRVHTDAKAAEAAEVMQARAFTVGSDIFFGRGTFSPASTDGRRLLAHELTHTLQQDQARPIVQRAPVQPSATPAADPLCSTFNVKITTGMLSAQAANLLAGGGTEQRHAVVRTIKRILRCAGITEQGKARKDLVAVLGDAVAATLWTEAGTPFGGYTGTFPSFAPDIKGQLTSLGASDIVPSGQFELSGSGSTHRARAKHAGAAANAGFARTDIVYFRGHQYAQYRAPGLFADGSETWGFDLRYIGQAGGFGNVKLMVSTSCATLCTEAFDVFHGLFPNAVLLGYRKSAPLEGDKVRASLQTHIKGIGRPLLLEESVDIGAITSAWKAVIELRHRGDTASRPGYYDGTGIHSWDGKAWSTISPSDPTNKCKQKGEYESSYPAPP